MYLEWNLEKLIKLQDENDYYGLLITKDVSLSGY